MTDRYPHVVKQVMERPWAILPGTLAAIRDLVALRAGGERLTNEEIRERISGPSWAARDARRGGRQAARTQTTGGAVAVIPVAGVIIPKANLFSDISGGTSVQQFQEDFLAAMNDRDVGAVVLDIDSPGGSADLLPELAATMRSVRGQKPVLAVANTLMASAAYWIGSQADEVAVSPSGLAGSIGVFASHQDFSAALEKEGVDVTLISAGKYKTEGNPFEPLSDDALAHIQELVDDAYAAFTSDVSKGRKVPVADVRGGFGEGRVLTAKQAVSEGLADRVESLEQTIARAQQMASAGAASTASAGDHEPPRVTHVHLDQVDHTVATNHANAEPEASLTTQIDGLLRSADEILTVAGRFASLTQVKRDQLTALRARIDELVANPTTPPDDDEPGSAAAATDDAGGLTEDDEFAFASARWGAPQTATIGGNA